MSKPFDERQWEASQHSNHDGSNKGEQTKSNKPPIRSRPAAAAVPPSRTKEEVTLHQPHGAAAIGPSPSNVSAATSSTTSNLPPHHPYQQQQQQQVVSLESPLPPMVQRSLGDRSNEKRKNAALEIEALIKSLQEANNMSMIHSVIAVLSKDFCTSMNANYRKGGLVGLAATAIGLMNNAAPDFLHVLLPPILHCFDDPESRVRYYACESLYNVAKVSRKAVLQYFNPIFEGLTKLFADVDVDVKNGANLLDRLIKDIATEAEDAFDVEQFLPLLQNYIRRTNPYIRSLIVGWITLLDSIPDMNMLDYLPDFLDGLFNMLADSNREIRQAADSALSEFLRQVSLSQTVEFGPMISILVLQCQSKERLNRLTAVTWLAELIHHPHSGGDAALLPDNHVHHVLGAILSCISDREREIRLVAERTNHDLLDLVRDTSCDFSLKPLLETLTKELLQDDVPTKMAALGWINMLMEKRTDMNQFTQELLLPVLLRTLSDPSDPVVLLDLQVLSRISLTDNIDRDRPQDEEREEEKVEKTEEVQFQLVLNAILNLFAQDRQLLETRGSLIIRKLCVLLNAKSVYIRMADTLSSFEDGADMETLQFISTMVQTLNLILLTAAELHDLRSALAGSFQDGGDGGGSTKKDDSSTGSSAEQEAGVPAKEKQDNVFATIFHCWCHNPVATFSLCLLAQTYDLSFALVKRFSEMEDVTVGFLMQVDKLVHLLESPIFVHLRLQLLDVEAPYHAPLLKSIYGVLMCLPQGDAFRLLNDRLTTVCNLRENLGLAEQPVEYDDNDNELVPTVSKQGLDMDKLLARFDHVTQQHRAAKLQAEKLAAEAEHEASRSEILNTPGAAIGSGQRDTSNHGSTNLATNNKSSTSGPVTGSRNRSLVAAQRLSQNKEAGASVAKSSDRRGEKT